MTGGKGTRWCRNVGHCPLIEFANPWRLGWSAGQVPGQASIISPTTLIAGARPVSSFWCLSPPTHSPPPPRGANTLGCLGRVCAQPASKPLLPRSIAQTSGVASQQHACPVPRLPNQDQAGDVRAVSMHRGVMPSCASRCNTGARGARGSRHGLTDAVACGWRRCDHAQHYCSLIRRQLLEDHLQGISSALGISPSQPELTASPYNKQNSKTLYPAGLTGGLSGSISVKASPLPQTGAHAMRPTLTHSRRPRDSPPASWPLSFPLLTTAPTLALFLDRLDRLLSRSRTRERPPSIHNLRSLSVLLSAGGNKSFKM